MFYKKTNIIWITWYTHRRTSSLCDYWNIPLYLVCSQNKTFKRLFQTCSTIFLIFTKRPRILIVQNPSLGSTILGLALRPILRYRLVVDAHNEGIQPFLRNGYFIELLTSWLIKKADLTIVTNKWLAYIVNHAGGNAAILPDPLPSKEYRNLNNYIVNLNLIVVISTFAPDEPLDQLLNAANLLPSLEWQITGNSEKCSIPNDQWPPNAYSTGFLEEEDYWSLLKQAAIVLDLSKMPDCIVCGAYEAISLGKATILSDNRATRELFGNCSILCDNNAESIAHAVLKGLNMRAMLENSTRNFAHYYDISWSKQANYLLKRINQ
jgi:glycosyltransferase involved in cell wall biosynthesis